MGKAAPGDPIFMKVPGVLGEPTEKGHENWIELDSWNWKRHPQVR
jgi:type VI protein secretion system component Hcp